MKWFFVLAAALSLNAHGGSIYLCRAYSGGTFWASNHCNQHSALIERIVSVPDSLPFAQQVKLAEQQRAGSSNTHTTTRTITTTNNNSALQSRKAECQALEAQIANYDSMARQPQSAQTQDRITALKKKARDRQFAIRC